MMLRAAMAATAGKAHTSTNTRQLWNWYAEPIWKLQPGERQRETDRERQRERSDHGEIENM
ncbi:hypothetical protein AALO_G00182820, partial [Alosa alosa]